MPTYHNQDSREKFAEISRKLTLLGHAAKRLTAQKSNAEFRDRMLAVSADEKPKPSPQQADGNPVVGIINANIPSSRSGNIFVDVIEGSAGNTGNSYIGTFLERSLAGTCTVKRLVNNIYIDNMPSKNELSSLDVIIFSFQDFLKSGLSYFSGGDPFGKLEDMLKTTEAIPLVIGIGVNSQDCNLSSVKALNTLVSLLKTICKRGGYIATRCNQTTEFLASLGIDRVVTTGCPTLFAYEVDSNALKRATSLAIEGALVGVNGIFFNPRIIEANTFPVLQDEPGWLRLISSPASTSYTDLSYNLDMSREYTRMIYNAIIEGRVRLFTDIQDASCFYSELDFSIGSRVHGAIASLNGGTPAIVTNEDLRAKNMCQMLNIPNITGHGFNSPESGFGAALSAETIVQLLADHDWGEFLIRRKKYGETYRQLLRSTGIDCKLFLDLQCQSSSVAGVLCSPDDIANSSGGRFLSRIADQSFL